MIYRHRQTGWVGLFAILLLAALMAAAGLTTGVPAIPTALILLIVVGLCLLFSSQTIEVTSDSVICKFGPGILAKRVPLQDIAGVEVMPTRWYDGWGVHLTPRGWLYNVSGFGAVEFTLRGGRRFRLGTDDPENLVRVIRALPATNGSTAREFD